MLLLKVHTEKKSNFQCLSNPQPQDEEFIFAEKFNVYKNPPKYKVEKEKFIGSPRMKLTDNSNEQNRRKVQYYYSIKSRLNQRRVKFMTPIQLHSSNLYFADVSKKEKFSQEWSLSLLKRQMAVPFQKTRDLIGHICKISVKRIKKQT